ncbi:MAG TPA: helix-turn-helix transcriptional regulator [Solirubrobacteraceae bacterium]
MRAARAYAGLDQAEVAQKLGKSVGTYKRMEQGTRPVSKPERTKIAQLCGVPIEFMDEGFDALMIVSDDLLARKVLEEVRALRQDLAAQLPTSRRMMEAIARARAALDVDDGPAEPANTG